MSPAPLIKPAAFVKTGAADTTDLNEEFWKPIIDETDFKQYVTNKYSILNNVVNLAKLDAH